MNEAGKRGSVVHPPWASIFLLFIVPSGAQIGSQKEPLLHEYWWNCPANASNGNIGTFSEGRPTSSLGSSFKSQYYFLHSLTSHREWLSTNVEAAVKNVRFCSVVCQRPKPACNAEVHFHLRKAAIVKFRRLFASLFRMFSESQLQVLQQELRLVDCKTQMSAVSDATHVKCVCLCWEQDKNSSDADIEVCATLFEFCTFFFSWLFVCLVCPKCPLFVCVWGKSWEAAQGTQ